MSRLLFLVIFALTPMLTSCKHRPDAGNLVKKAIAAHGGKDALAKPRMGTLKGATRDGSLVTEELFDLPTQWKRTITVNIKGKKTTAYVVMREKQVWHWEQDAGVQAADCDQEFGPYIGIVCSLLELIEADVKTSVLREVTIHDQPAIGLRTERNGIRRDYYFHKTSGLLARIENDWEPEPGKKASMRSEYGDYRDVGGIKLPFRQTTYIQRDKSDEFRLFSEFLVDEIRFLDKLPPNSFAIPGNVDKELSSLRGVWTHVSREEDGKQKVGEDKTYKFTVTGNKWTLGNDEVISQSGTLKIVDASSVPKKIDMTVLTGAGKGLTVYAVYQIEDDIFSYCGSTESRPKSMKTKPGDDSYRTNFRRLK